MARLPCDPQLFPTPDFLTEAFRARHVALVDDVRHPEITTEELAADKLREDHIQNMDMMGAQWDAQVAEDQRVANEQAEVAEAEHRSARIEALKRAETAQANREKKRVPLVEIDMTKPTKAAAFKFHPRAVAKLERREFEHLWMFGPAASAEALSIDMTRIDSGRVTFKAHDNGLVTTEPKNTIPAPLKCVPNCNLTLAEIMALKTGFLECMRLMPLVWSTQNLNMFGQFFLGLEFHPLSRTAGRCKALAHYFTLQYMTFFKQLKSGQDPGNIAMVNKEVLAECIEWARNQGEEQRKKDEEQRKREDAQRRREDAQQSARDECLERQLNDLCVIFLNMIRTMR